MVIFPEVTYHFTGHILHMLKPRQMALRCSYQQRVTVIKFGQNKSLDHYFSCIKIKFSSNIPNISELLT